MRTAAKIGLALIVVALAVAAFITGWLIAGEVAPK